MARTTPRERARSLLLAELLLQLLAGREYEEIDRQDLRENAEKILDHFPTKSDVFLTASLVPEVWQFPIEWFKKNPGADEKRLS